MPRQARLDASQEFGYPGTQVARFLGVANVAINRAANSEELPEFHQYL